MIKTILITGGAGSLGAVLVHYFLTCTDYTIRVFSRDEYKHWKFKKSLISEHQKRIRFLIGDVRDKDRLVRACEDVDIVIHAAALKQIESGEYNPQEVIKTNVMGTSHVIDACLANNVKKAMLVSSDKAVNPSNLYGASKYASEKLWIDANNIKGKRKIVFSAVRFGNLRGSIGSVFELFEEQAKGGVFTITHKDMTRYDYDIMTAVEFVGDLLKKKLLEPAIYAPKMSWIKIIDLPKEFHSKPKIEFIGLRDGEKLYEELCSEHEPVREMDNHYIIGKHKDAKTGISIKSGQ